MRMYLNDEEFNEIMIKLFEAVGKKFVSIKQSCKGKSWYTKYTWTQNQEAEFEKWLKQYVIDNPCPHLLKSGNKFSCEIYNQRPEGCRIFDGSKYDWLECAWKNEETDMKKSVLITTIDEEFERLSSVQKLKLLEKLECVSLLVNTNENNRLKENMPEKWPTRGTIFKLMDSKWVMINELRDYRKGGSDWISKKESSR